MNEKEYLEILRDYMGYFLPGTIHFIGANKFRNEVAVGKKVINWRKLKIVRIPQLDGRVYIDSGFKVKKDLCPVMYVWELNNPDDLQDSRNRAAMIGLNIPTVQPGWMIARPEYDQFFDEDGNLIARTSDEAAEENAVSEDTAEADSDADIETQAETEPTAEFQENEDRVTPETPAETKPAPAYPYNDDRAAEEEKKAAEPAAAEGKTKGEETVQKTSVKKTAKGDMREAYHMEEIEARLIEKEKILDKKIQQVEAERQKLLEKETEMTEQMKQMEEIRKELESLKRERVLRITDRQKQRMNMLDHILRAHTNTINELAKRKPYGLMSLQQIRTVNEILDEIRSIVASTDAEDFLHLAEEPRMDDLEHFPGTTYSEMALIISAYQYIRSLYNWDRLYFKDPADEENGNASADDDRRQ